MKKLIFLLLPLLILTGFLYARETGDTGGEVAAQEFFLAPALLGGIGSLPSVKPDSLQPILFSRNGLQ